MTLRPLTAGDLPAATTLWNACLLHDPVTADRLASISLSDPTVEPEAALVAEQNSELVGLAFVSVRSAPKPDDEEADAVHLKAFAFREGSDAAGDALLAAVDAFARRKGRTRVIIRGAAGGRYVSAAIDVRYEALLHRLEANGYADLETIQDAEVELGTWRANDYQQERERRCEEKQIEAVPFTPELLPAVRAFAAHAEVPDWFPPGWEEAWIADPRVIVAVENGRVLSYAQYQPGRPAGSFGPTATLPDRQGQGIGTLVLLRCMQALKAAGTPLATASWVWPPEFYLKSGWRIGRSYRSMKKALQ